MRRATTGEARSYHTIYPPLDPGALIDGALTRSLQRAWDMARPDAF